jgi:hypothetical protein
VQLNWHFDGVLHTCNGSPPETEGPVAVVEQSVAMLRSAP